MLEMRRAFRQNFPCRGIKERQAPLAAPDVQGAAQFPCVSSAFMRLSAVYPRPRAGLAVIMTAVLTISSPAAAQGFFEQLFGGFSKPAQSTARSGPLTPGGRAYPQGFGPSPFSTPVHRPDHAGEDREGGRKYRTVCVRMCDGYYWPISFATTRGHFSAEQGRCKSSCGEEARLFYFPANGGAVETMEDLSGRLYGQLPTAFKYRRKLVAGCQCKPEPWSDAELARHSAYADAASPNGRAKDNDTPPPRTVAFLMAEAKRQAAEAPAANPAAPLSPALPRALAAAADPADGIEPPPLRAASNARREKSHLERQAGATARRVRAASGQGGGGWGLTKQPKYTWPGDAPARR